MAGPKVACLVFLCPHLHASSAVETKTTVSYCELIIQSLSYCLLALFIQLSSI